MDLLDAGRARVRHAQMDVPGRQKFTDAAAALAGEGDHAHLALVRGLDGGDHVARVAGRRDPEQHVALGAERPHLLREYLLERVVVGDRREQRRVGGQGDRRQLRPLPLEAADQLRGKVLRVGRRPAVAVREDLAVGEQALGEDGGGARDLRRERLAGLGLEAHTLVEVLADALDVVDHGPGILAGGPATPRSRRAPTRCAAGRATRAARRRTGTGERGRASRDTPRRRRRAAPAWPA